MLRGNGIYKVASVLIAIVLAIYVNAERNPFETRSFTLTVATVNQEPGVLVKSVNPPTIQIQVSGPQESVLLVSPQELRASINLADLQAGTHEVHVAAGPAAGTALPSDVQFTPSRSIISVTLESVARQSRPLEPVFQRPAPPGFSYGAPDVQPPAGFISGPRESVARVARLEVLVDAQASGSHPIAGKFAVQALDNNGKIVSDVKVTPPVARVRCEILRVPGQKEILVSPNITGVPAPSFRISSIQVAPQSVLVVGNPETLRGLNFVTTQEVNIAGATSNVVHSVQILLPAGVTTQASSQARVQVQIVPRG